MKTTEFLWFVVSSIPFPCGDFESFRTFDINTLHNTFLNTRFIYHDNGDIEISFCLCKISADIDDFHHELIRFRDIGMSCPLKYAFPLTHEPHPGPTPIVGAWHCMKHSKCTVYAFQSRRLTTTTHLNSTRVAAVYLSKCTSKARVHWRVPVLLFLKWPFCGFLKIEQIQVELQRSRTNNNPMHLMYFLLPPTNMVLETT